MITTAHRTSAEPVNPLTTHKIEERVAAALGVRADVELRIVYSVGRYSASITAVGVSGLGRGNQLDSAVRQALTQFESVLCDGGAL